MWRGSEGNIVPRNKLKQLFQFGDGAGSALEALAAEELPLGVLGGRGCGAGECGVLLDLGSVQEEFFAANHRAKSVQISTLDQCADRPG